MPAPDTDRSVADAINRVLEAERATAAAITAAELAARARIEAARDERRRILEHARRRITRLHERAQGRLERELAAVEAEEYAADARWGTIASDLTARVVATVVARLTGEATS